MGRLNPVSFPADVEEDLVEECKECRPFMHHHRAYVPHSDLQFDFIALLLAHSITHMNDCADIG